MTSAKNTSRTAYWVWWGAVTAWLLLNGWQAAVTGLDADEAYYWMYGQRLDWGYFDHPPFVAVLTSLAAWLPGELGVRLGNVLLGGLTWWGLWELVERPTTREQVISLIAVSVALPMLQVYAFIATPDGPLLCTTVWFFVAYRYFWQRPSIGSALLWGGSMVLMLYAKYHGILVIGITVLANVRLWRRPLFYLAAVVGAALYLPHLYWQYVHDFPSFRYHLVGRADAYQVKHTVVYLLNQLVVAGPLLFPLVGWALFRRQPVPTLLERSFRWLTVGLWTFFFLSSFVGGTEAQWTAVLSIGFVYLVYRYAEEHSGFRRWLWRLGIWSFGLFFLLRLWLGTRIVPLPSQLQKQFVHQNWTQTLADRADYRPVVFSNTYRDLSLYRFYTRREAWTLTDVAYRPSQYDLWPDAADYQDRSVLFVGPPDWELLAGDSIKSGRRQYCTLVVDSFQVADRVHIEWTPPNTLPSGDTLTLRLKLHNPYPHAIRFDHPSLPISIALMVNVSIDNWQEVPAARPLTLPVLRAGADQVVAVPFYIPPTFVGKYPTAVGLYYTGLPPMLQSTVEQVLFE